MRCADCRLLLSKYVDGEALPAEREQVEKHIGACQACSRALVQYGLTRSRVSSLPQYRPDVRLRHRLFASIQALNAPPEEIRITRRVAPAVHPVAYRARPAGARLLGHMASAFAVLVVVAAGLLVWQITGLGPALPTAYATGTPLGLVVPTRFVPIAQNAGPLPGAPPTALPFLGPSADSASPVTAASTATSWSPAEDAQVVHNVRDESYGYQFQYPSGWWTASAIPVAGLLAHRLLRPSAPPAGDAADYRITVDVLDNVARLTPAEVLKNKEVLARWQEPGAPDTARTATAGGLSGFRLSSDSQGQSQQATYLFAGPLVYRVSLVVSTPQRNSIVHQPPAAADLPGSTTLGQVLSSFRADPGAADRGTVGYLPVLCLHGGEVWQADPLAGTIRQITHTGNQTGGRVHGFALAPDLARLALLLGDPGDGQTAHEVAIQALDPAAAPTVLWTVNEIHAVAWDGDQQLLAIGGAPTGKTPFGLYRLALQGSARPEILADFTRQPDLAHTASSLALAPDRRWISFLASGANGLDLYTVSPDGTLAEAMPASAAKHAGVSQYAWLPPADAPSVPRMVVLAGRQVQRLTMPGSGQDDLARETITAKGATNSSELAVAAGGEVAALSRAAGGAQVALWPDQAPASSHLVALPSAPLTGSLSLAPSGQAVFYRQAMPSGAEQVLMIDAAGAAHSLGELPR